MAILDGDLYTLGTARREACAELSMKARGVSEGHIHFRRYQESAKRVEEYLDGFSKIDSVRLKAQYDGAVTVTIARRILEKWAVRLVVHGRRIDDQLDALLVEIVGFGFSWSDSVKVIHSRLSNLLTRRKGVREFEREVEDYLEAVAKSAERNLDVIPITQLLNQLHRTYDRAYDLCTFKITTVTSTRATYASLVLAVVAVVIALAGLITTPSG